MIRISPGKKKTMEKASGTGQNVIYWNKVEFPVPFNTNGTQLK